MLWTAGSIFKNARGSLERLTAEGVSVAVIHRILNGWLGLDEREREAGSAAGGEARHGGAMAGERWSSPEFD